MNNIITLDFKKGSIPEYQKRMLSEMEPEFFLPMSFAKTEDGEQISYDLTGYVPLQEIDFEKSVHRLFGFIGETVKGLIVAGEYLIPPESIRLKKSTIFVGKDGDVRMLFAPEEPHWEEDENRLTCEKTINAKLYDLLSEIGESSDSEPLRVYIDSTKRLLKSNCDISKLLRHISKVRRESYFGDDVNML